MIVDASVAFKWLFIEEGSDAAKALIGRGDLVAPNLMFAEVGNALWKKGMRGEIADRSAYPAQVSIISSIVTTVMEDDIMPRALEIALLLEHPIYDCVYVALAERQADVLVTADERLLNKVRGSDFSNLVEALR